jgi:hypothetical protein
MAHYALLDGNNVVLSVIVGKDEGSDTNWETYYSNITGKTCKRTSYNTTRGIHKSGGTPFRKNYAGIGFTYDESRDAFIPAKPYNSWVLDENTCQWQSPTPMPTDGVYKWDENTLSWIEIEINY